MATLQSSISTKNKGNVSSPLRGKKDPTIGVF